MVAIFLQLNETERDSYSNLALEIFTKFAPKDARHNKSECPHCATAIPEW